MKTISAKQKEARAFEAGARWRELAVLAYWPSKPTASIRSEGRRRYSTKKGNKP